MSTLTPLPVTDDRDKLEESYRNCIRELEAERDEIQRAIDAMTRLLNQYWKRQIGR